MKIINHLTAEDFADVTSLLCHVGFTFSHGGPTLHVPVGAYSVRAMTTREAELNACNLALQVAEEGDVKEVIIRKAGTL